jgi:quercetin dioxygenase-like cupin family protein
MEPERNAEVGELSVWRPSQRVLVLSGEIDMELEGGVVVHLKVGDTVIQRGTVHTWVNRSPVPAVTVFVLVDATPPEIDGKKLGTLFPTEAAP